MTINNLNRLPVIGDPAGIYFVRYDSNTALSGLYVKAYINTEAVLIANNVLSLINAILIGNVTVTGNLLTRTDLNQSNAIGRDSLLNALPNSTCNDAFGMSVFLNLTTGNYNVGIGQNTGQALVDGSNNTFIGRWSGKHIVHGNANVVLGQNSGRGFDSSNSIYIGDSCIATADNEIVIGKGKTGRGANTTTIGSNTTTKTYLEGEVIAPNVTVDNVLKSKDIIVDGLNKSITSRGIATTNADDFGIDFNSQEVQVNQQIITYEPNISLYNVGDTFYGYYGQDDNGDDVLYVMGTITLIDNTYIRISTIATETIQLTSWYVQRNVSNNANKIETFGYIEKDTINNKTVFNGSLNPAFDSTYNLGSPSNYWKEVYAYSSAINLSDARLKTDIAPFTLDELAASKQLSKEVGTYKFLDAVKEKGDLARLHIGLTVQRAIEIMTANNLNPFAYGFICYDEWDDEFVTIPEVVGVEYRAAYTEEIKDDEGIVIDTIEYPEIEEVKAVPSYEKQTQKAGDLYSFRYTELLAFISAGFEARLSLLESK